MCVVGTSLCSIRVGLVFSLLNSVCGQFVDGESAFFFFPSSFDEVGDLSSLHEGVPVLFVRLGGVVVFRFVLEDTERGKVAVGQSSTDLDFVANSLQEVELMSVLVVFTRWVGIV